MLCNVIFELLIKTIPNEVHFENIKFFIHKIETIQKLFLNYKMPLIWKKKLLYDEPPTWFYPVRHNLGAILIEAGKYADAELIYKEDLSEFPENGWALFGLIESLKKQNKSTEVLEAEKRFTKAWQYADIKLSSSRII